MRHLVVAREGGIDRGAAAHHVRQHAEDDEVADDHAHETAQQGIDAAAVAAGPDVPPGRAGGRRPLQHDLPDEQHQRAGDVEPIRQEGAIAGVGALLLLGAADRQDHGLGVAGEEVAAAGAATAEQPHAGRVPPLDLRTVGRRRARHHRATLLLDPAERRAGCRPGWRPSATRGRSPTPRGGIRPRPPSGPGSGRSRSASRGAGRAARARRPPGTRSRGRPSVRRRPAGGRSAVSRAANIRSRRWSRG